MKDWTKWIVIAGAAVLAFLILKRKGAASMSSEPDAPGVKTPGDVKYSAYKRLWEWARSRTLATFSCPGSVIQGEDQKWVWLYRWRASDGSLENATKLIYQK